LLVDVVQNAALQTRNLLKKQIEKTKENAQWPIGRPILGQNAGHSTKAIAPGQIALNG